MNIMTLACLAALGIAGGLTAIMYYKSRGRRERKKVRKVVAEEAPREILAEQLD
jgi:Flp pilus assembly protein TadB